MKRKERKAGGRRRKNRNKEGAGEPPPSVHSRPAVSTGGGGHATAVSRRFPSAAITPLLLCVAARADLTDPRHAQKSRDRRHHTTDTTDARATSRWTSNKRGRHHLAASSPPLCLASLPRLHAADVLHVVAHVAPRGQRAAVEERALDGQGVQMGLEPIGENKSKKGGCESSGAIGAWSKVERLDATGTAF